MRTAVRGVSRDAAATAAAVLFDLLLAFGERADLQHHGRGRGGSRPRWPRALSRGLLELSRPAAARGNALRLHPQADDTVPPAGEPASADDHGRPGDRGGPVPG